MKEVKNLKINHLSLNSDGVVGIGGTCNLDKKLDSLLFNNKPELERHWLEKVYEQKCIHKAKTTGDTSDLLDYQIWDAEDVLVRLANK